MPKSLSVNETIALIMGGKVHDPDGGYRGTVIKAIKGSGDWVKFETDQGLSEQLCNSGRHLQKEGWIGCCNGAYFKIYPAEGEQEPSCSICKSQCKGDKVCEFYQSILGGNK